VRVLPPIEAGLDPDAFLAKLVEVTEAASDELLVETVRNNPHLPLPPTAKQRLRELGSNQT
jgi:1-acyl-sn-glycerol-3-phosphate acyltransferase